MMHEIYGAQRQALVELRNDRQISSEVMRRVERELDLEESRLEVRAPVRRLYSAGAAASSARWPVLAGRRTGSHSVAPSGALCS
jgi:DNA helicase HerA-like ATPase